MDTAQAKMVLDFWLGPLGDCHSSRWDPLHKPWDRGPEAPACRQNFWWHGGPQLDAEVSSKFGDLLVSVAANPNPPTVVAQSRRDLAEEVLALVIVLSQFSRHILPRGRLDNPGTSEEYDLHARRLANWTIAEGLHKELRHYEKSFLYMPFIQSEDLVDQDHACQLFKDQHNQAIDEGRRAPGSVSPGAAWMTCRRDVVARFGRLPFRNEQLGRESTPEELAYLSQWSRACA